MSDKKVIAIVNGPNINLLGIREPDIYGSYSWAQIEEQLIVQAKSLNLSLLFFQSNHEGDIVDFLQKNLSVLDGVVINPAAFTHGGYSIIDVLTATNMPFIEVHLSNIFARGGWHSETIFAQRAIGHINGFGKDVYSLGLLAIKNYLLNRV